MSLSSLIILIVLGLLYGALFKFQLSSHLPHLAVSLIVWQWMVGFINDSCATLTSAEGVIRQMRLPYTLHARRVAFRNTFVAAHSLALIPIVFLIFGQVPEPEALLDIPGLVLICINMVAGGLLLGMNFVRSRDIPLTFAVDEPPGDQATSSSIKTQETGLGSRNTDKKICCRHRP
jgi:lipopolysaccharide transport system permease protein